VINQAPIPTATGTSNGAAAVESFSAAVLTGFYFPRCNVCSCHEMFRAQRSLPRATVGASANPCSNSYHGPAAFSERETLALATFAADEDREGEIGLYIDHHCCGDMYLQPYGALQTLPAEHEAIDALGAIGKRATDESCASGSSPGTSPSGCNYRQGPIYTTIYRTIYLFDTSCVSCV
jgi:hypothetical protein